MSRNTRTAWAAASLSLALAMTTSAPAHAWGEGEQNFVAGVAATVAAGAVVKSLRKPEPRPVVVAPRPNYYVAPAPAYAAPPPVYRAPAPVQVQADINSVPAAQTFNRIGERGQKAIQFRLKQLGYYGGTVDGTWGPGTHAAVRSYALATGRGEDLRTMRGAANLYRDLVGR